MIPDFFTLIFDGWSCSRENASWTNAHDIVVRRLIACGVQPLPAVLNGETAEDFGFAAEDIGDYISYVLEMYEKSFTNIECIVGDNASVNRRLADLINQWHLPYHPPWSSLPSTGFPATGQDPPTLP